MGEEGPCVRGYAWLEGDVYRYRAGHGRMKERQKEIWVVDLKGDGETCK